MLDSILQDMVNRTTIIGALLLGAVFFLLATTVVIFVRRLTRNIEPHLTDITALRFVSTFTQVLTYVIGFVFYAHLIPELRALGTALLAGVSVVSIVVGLAAQNTLGNLIAGFSLVLYRPFQVGDTIQLTRPKGSISAHVELISLGFTMLRDEENHEILVPNSIMMSSTVIRIRQQSAK
jgi:small-conductance mechanosensitive channel